MNKQQLAKLVGQAEQEISSNDPLQAAEKLYKVAEECIKLLAIQNRMASKDKKRWNTKELNEYAESLKSIYGNDLYLNWKIALEDLHREGFHEDNLDTAKVYDRISSVIYLLGLIE